MRTASTCMQSTNSEPGKRNASLEVWGGAEYTRNRVRDKYFDQMNLSGHSERMRDYEQFAELGIRTFRFGLLWERYELDPSWSWSDERLHWMQEAGIRPIVSLMHHGSGPEHTSLMDPEFPYRFASYAESVAQRYPWVEAYTPINEPHTTARFSGMYGIWYPHHREKPSYLRALLHQTKATVLSMEAIRRVNPNAQLIQTEDMGCISGTEALHSTWELMNERRWLSFDLLCGRVDRHHPMFGYMRSYGVGEDEILWFLEHTCLPDVIGANYYLTSDRFLDHHVHLYPRERMSVEGSFVDVEAVRGCPQGICGFGSMLQAAWERYGIPLAITEVHLGGPVEDQIRWAAEAWEGIMWARSLGANCFALTFWALLGSFYWNELVTRENGHYEPGVFDVRGGDPVPTELAEIVAQLARCVTPQHPALSEAGWWRKRSRLCFPMLQHDMECAV